MALNLLNLGFHPSTLVSPKPLKDRFVLGCSRVQQISFTESENSLIEALLGIQGRGRSSSPQQLNAVERAVQVLERLGGVPDPTNSNLIEGRWQLIFTTRPGTASPIQRTFVGVDFFSVFQEVYLRTNDPRVCNIVSFSDAIGELKVELLGDEAKGWLDTTYLSNSGNLRISRGNKKQTEPRQKLLTAISSGKGIKEAIEELISLKQNSGQEEPELEEGEWQMMWNSQTVTDSWIENAVNGLMGKQIIKDGRIKILVDILLGLKFSMTGNFVKTGSRLYDVTMDDAAIIGGPFGYPLQVKNKFILELLYSDEKLRVSRGYNNILFVHARTDALR
ncbi:probable plastid-lipid-associated protein 12, chloroplastic isoform X5 [Phaseolus vulgaris]|uniref:probable plastid-lipid-associated protein 12, chloroplastic isoform X5 n=1 Tax=Phaseolus vulgaris TaxID=3885 RepID=UPI0035CA399D